MNASYTRLLSHADAADLQTLVEACADYVMLAHGSPPSAEAFSGPRLSVSWKDAAAYDDFARMAALAGARAIRLAVLRANPGAQRFWRRLGFTPLFIRWRSYGGEPALVDVLSTTLTRS